MKYDQKKVRYSEIRTFFVDFIDERKYVLTT